MKPLVWALAPPDLTRWRVGNTGVEGVWRFDSGTAGRNVLITALVHGNELCGAWAVLDLLSSGLRPRCGVLTLARCNLAAFASFDARASWRPSSNAPTGCSTCSRCMSQGPRCC